MKIKSIEIIKVLALLIISISIISGIIYYDRLQNYIAANRIQTLDSKKESEQDNSTDSDDDRTFPDISFEDFFKGEDEEKIPTEPEVVYDVRTVKEAGWIPAWGYKSGIESLTRYRSRFHSVSPVWYGATEKGELVDRRASDLLGIHSLAQSNDILLIPSIAMFDEDLMSKILNKGSNYSNHINSIVEEVNTNDYDGIDLDYEEVKEEDKGLYLQFIKDLATQLDQSDKLLSITVISQWQDTGYSSLIGTRKAQDLIEIGKYADQVRVMAYDFTTPSSPTAGPIAPIEWVEQVLDYTVKKVPKEKVWLGIHLYGYEWSNGSGHSLTYEDAVEIQADESANSTFDNGTGEGLIEYSCPPHTCTVYHQNPEGISMRKTLAAIYGIAGVTYWRIGDEGELLSQ